MIVNRLWQHHFGAGLVKTVNDFGTKGDRPSHPGAARLAGGDAGRGRLAAQADPPADRAEQHLSPVEPVPDRGRGRCGVDPENRLLWHFSRRRLDGRGDPRRHARGLGPAEPQGRRAERDGAGRPGARAAALQASQWQVARDPAEHDRRSIYLFAKRNLRLPFLETFDAPALLTSCAAARVEHPRAPGAGAAQRPALERPRRGLRRRLATRDRRRPGSDRRSRLPAGAGPAADARGASDSSLEFLRDQPLEEFALAMFNLNGFLYVP